MTVFKPSTNNSWHSRSLHKIYLLCQSYSSRLSIESSGNNRYSSWLQRFLVDAHVLCQVWPISKSPWVLSQPSNGLCRTVQLQSIDFVESEQEHFTYFLLLFWYTQTNYHNVYKKVSPRHSLEAFLQNRVSLSLQRCSFLCPIQQ